METADNIVRNMVECQAREVEALENLEHARYLASTVPTDLRIHYAASVTRAARVFADMSRAASVWEQKYQQLR